MGAKTDQQSKKAWSLARRQHGVISRQQLLDIGYSSKAIKHRVASGRLHPIHTGVYAVGRPELTQEGRWMAAVLACGEGAALSHQSAAQLWGIRKPVPGRIHVTVHATRKPRQPGIRIHRRADHDASRIRQRQGIPLLSPLLTLVDLAASTDPTALERAVNEADGLDLIDLDQAHGELNGLKRAGAAKLRKLLDRATFALTDSELEQYFLPIARKAGLPKPETQVWINDFRVDFHWPELGLVVEADSLRYHRTPFQQTRDRIRDQTHAVAGLRTLRFTHWQIARERAYVAATLKAVA